MRESANPMLWKNVASPPSSRTFVVYTVHTLKNVATKARPRYVMKVST
jgi:hypothetical protein